jgi:hypothetical protein
MASRRYENSRSMGITALHNNTPVSCIFPIPVRPKPRRHGSCFEATLLRYDLTFSWTYSIAWSPQLPTRWKSLDCKHMSFPQELKLLQDALDAAVNLHQ